MRKILKAPNNLVRRVLSKSSNISQSSSHESKSKPKKKDLMSEEQQLATEIEALKDQVENLKAAIGALQDDTEKKEVALANIARQKEKLTLELLKQKRTNNNLLHQLEDERKFYYKEKELYCQEMNEFKKLKRAISSASTNSNKDEVSVEQYKKDIAKIKLTLNQTLEANYNLSIKFLRMKNTKTCLKTELKTMQIEHEKLVNDYKAKIESLSEELNELINEKLNSPISCSSKKYLQLVKQNSCLVYENLCLQLKVDNMHVKFEKVMLEKNKSESNSKLRYIKHESSNKPKSPKKTAQKEHKRVRIKDDRPEKLEKDVSNIASTSKMYNTKPTIRPSKEEILKIYERNKLPGIPDIKMLSDFETPLSTSNYHTRVQIPTVQENVQNQDSAKKSILMKTVLDKPNSKLDLFQVSNISSRTSLATTGGLMRVHSSPEIAQTISFHKN